MDSALATKDAPPDRSLQQRRDAIKKANEVRFARARLKKDLKSRRVSVLPLLKEPPAYLESMRVFDLLMALPHVGRVKVNRLLWREQISPSKTVGGLSPRQRQCLLAAVEPYARGVSSPASLRIICGDATGASRTAT